MGKCSHVFSFSSEWRLKLVPRMVDKMLIEASSLSSLKNQRAEGGLSDWCHWGVKGDFCRGRSQNVGALSSAYEFLPNLWLTLMRQKQGRLLGAWLRIKEANWDLNCCPAESSQVYCVLKTGKQNVTESRIPTHHNIQNVQEAHPILLNIWRNREECPFSRAKTLRWSRR